MISKLFAQFIKHKIAASLILLVVAGGGYWGYGKIFSNDGAIRYATAQVQKGTLIVSISGSGQVSASNQVDIKPKVSGEVTWVGIKVGQEVGLAQALAGIDDTDAKKAVADAALDLEETKLQLDRDTAQAPIDYERKLESLENAKSDLEKEYEDAFNTVSNAFLDLPSVMTGLSGILFDETLNKGFTNESAYRNLFSSNIDDRNFITIFTEIASRDYKIAREAYDASFLLFKDITRFSARTELEKLLSETTDMAKAAAQAAKSEKNMLDAITDRLDKNGLKPSLVINGYQNDLKNYIGTINSNLSALLTEQRSLENLRGSITNIERDIKILEINNPSGINPIGLQISQNTIKKKEAVLADLKAKLADYTIRAPFAGVIAKVNAKKGDSASASAIIATLITIQKLAEISLNEVDIAKVKVGQKVTLTFDAIEGLSLTGEVAELESVGTVTQGVVTYGVKIGFDTQDERVKPGMSVSAAIIIDVKQNVLTVHNSAIKQQNGTAYAEIFMGEAQTPRQQTVQTGLSNDTMTEITSGLNEGDQVVTQTITVNTSQGQTQQVQGLRIPGISGGGGGGGPQGGGR